MLDNIISLPIVIQNIIQSYLPISVLICLTKENYIKYHNEFIKDKINDSYIRFIIRNNYFMNKIKNSII
jgi:hypothetical protein